MKVTEVKSLLVELVATDEFEDSDGLLYRRYGPESWEKQYGSDWCDVYHCAELEEAYQTFIRGANYV